MRNSLYILLVFAANTFCFAQNKPEWKDIDKGQAKKIIANFKEWAIKHPTYKVDTHFSSYKDHTTSLPSDESVGYIKKNGDNLNSLSVGIYSIQNANCRLAVDTTHKLILISEPKKALKTVADIDTAQIMRSVKRFLSYTSDNGIALRIEYKPNPNIGAIEVHTTKEGEIKKLVWYYSGKVPGVDDNDKDYTLPRVEVVFSNYKLNVSFDYKKEFDEKNYFTMVGKAFVPTSKFKNYKIDDTRIRKN